MRAPPSGSSRDPPTVLAWTATSLALVALAISAVAIVGYLRHVPVLVQVSSRWRGMSPITSLALVAVAVAVLGRALGLARIARASATVAALVGTAMLAVQATLGHDVVSPWLSSTLFGFSPQVAGRVSVATAACLLALGMANLPWRSARVGDIAAGLALVASGVALLGYAYGVGDLYALPIFRTMGANTSLGLVCLSLGALAASPRGGWASVIASREAGGGATRRQLAFLALPPVAGWLLLQATSARTLGPGAAMALLVVLTIVPLAFLILRDGRMLDALETERRAKADLQARLQGDLEDRLARQADQLAAESGERARSEQALHRAQRMEAVGQLTGGIAHDFNNLLMAVGGNLQLLTKRLAPEHPGRRYAQNASDAVAKGAKLTAQLLAFSRTQKLEARPVELDPVLALARELIGSAMGPLIDVRLDLGCEGGWALTDPDQLELAVLNLAVNARDAMPEGGVLTVASSTRRTRPAPGEPEVDHLQVSVSDTGAGMSAEVLEKAVEPFFTTKEPGKGTGLGLAQVYGFVRQCGGDMRIESEPGRGATVRLLFQHTAALAPASASPRAQPSQGRAGADGRRRSILVIDDDDSVRAVLVEALDAAGYEVVEARDGPSGLEALQRLHPSAAIIDFIMPGMHGAEVARRARLLLPDLPVIFVSGYFDTAALDAISGAVVVRKPVDLEGLQRTLSSIVH